MGAGTVVDEAVGSSWPGDAKALIAGFYPEVRRVLGDRIVGLLPFGSLAIGDFDPVSSDLDIVVATDLPLENEMEVRLRELYVELARRDGTWWKRLEVAIIPVDLLRRHDTASPRRHAFINTSIDVFWFGEDTLGDDWILNRRMAWKGNIAFTGPSPRTLIDPIDDDAVRGAIVRLLKESWAQHLNGSDWMKPAKYQAFTVLTMCRALYALEHGEVVTKPRAAAWAMASLDRRWVPLISDALANRSNPERRELTGTLELLRWTIQQAAPSAGST